MHPQCKLDIAFRNQSKSRFALSSGVEEPSNGWPLTAFEPFLSCESHSLDVTTVMLMTIVGTVDIMTV